MFRKIASASSPFIAYLVIAALLVLPGALAHAQATDFFSYAVIKVPNLQPPSEGSWHRVLSTQEEWEIFYREHAGADAHVPSIDFTQYRIVAGGLGLQPVSTRLVVDSVASDGHVVYVDVLIASPEPGCMVLDALAYPGLAVVIPQSAMPVKVTARRALHECGF